MRHAYVSGDWGPSGDAARAVCRDRDPVWMGPEHVQRVVALKDATMHDIDQHPVTGPVLFQNGEEL